MPKRYFAYKLTNGKAFPVIYYDELPTDGHGKLSVDLKQTIELPFKMYSLNLSELSKIYPYKEESKDEKFKLTEAGKAAWDKP